MIGRTMLRDKIMAMFAQRSLIVHTALLVTTTLMAGCFRIEAASPLRLTQPAASSSSPATAAAPASATTASIWPKRWSAGDAMGAIVPVDGPLSAWAGVRLGQDHYLRTGPADRTDAEAVARVAGTDTGYQFVLEGPGSFIFQRKDGDWRARQTNSKPAEMFKFVSARPLGKMQDITVVSLERTWMGYYDAATDKPRGLLVLVPGLFGVPEPVNDRFVEMCREDGWAVLRLLAPPSRFTARSTFAVDQMDLDVSAVPIARELGQRAAEVAYAVEAGVEYVFEKNPGLEPLPRALVGMSGGAIALSTVYARTPDLWDVAVFIAGGSNFLLTNENSNYASWVQALQFDWGDTEPTPAERAAIMDRLGQRYLDHAPLDAYSLAPLLQDKPVLMLHGKTDKAVPAVYGDELWERLGEPERWVFPVGHEILFITLNAQTARILRWLDEAVGPAFNSAKEAAEPDNTPPPPAVHP
jgi:hypothetical protein